MIKNLFKFVFFIILGVIAVIGGVVSIILMCLGVIGYLVWGWLMKEATRPRK